MCWNSVLRDHDVDLQVLGVIVHDSHLVGISALPSKHDAPLIVDSNTVISGVVALEGLKAVSRWRAKIAKLGSSVEHIELSHSNRGDLVRNGSLRRAPVEQQLRSLVTK